MVNSYPLPHPQIRQLLIYLLSPQIYLFPLLSPQVELYNTWSFVPGFFLKQILFFSQETADTCNYGFSMRLWWQAPNLRVGLLIVEVSWTALEWRSLNNTWKPHGGIS